MYVYINCTKQAQFNPRQSRIVLHYESTFIYIASLPFEIGNTVTCTIINSFITLNYETTSDFVKKFCKKKKKKKRRTSVKKSKF